MFTSTQHGLRLTPFEAKMTFGEHVNDERQDGREQDEHV